MKTREEFGKALRNHDWYYQYSDDARSYRRGSDQRHALALAHSELQCPYAMTELCKWAHKMILEDFAEEAPGEWFRQPRKYKYIAPTKLDELMPREEYEEITQWMIALGTSEGIQSIV